MACIRSNLVGGNKLTMQPNANFYKHNLPQHPQSYYLNFRCNFLPI